MIIESGNSVVAIEAAAAAAAGEAVGVRAASRDGEAAEGGSSSGQAAAVLSRCPAPPLHHNRPKTGEKLAYVMREQRVLLIIPSIVKIKSINPVYILLQQRRPP